MSPFTKTAIRDSRLWNKKYPPPPIGEEKLRHLEELARRATPGPWWKDPAFGNPWEVGVLYGVIASKEPRRESICTLDVRYGNASDAPRALDVDYMQVMYDASFIAAADPETVLALLAEIRRLKSLV